MDQADLEYFKNVLTQWLTESEGERFAAGGVFEFFGSWGALWRATRRARILLPLLVVALWLVCVGQYALRPGRYPSAEEYQALAAAIAAEEFANLEGEQEG